MKFHGKMPPGPNVEYVVLPRPATEEPDLDAPVEDATRLVNNDLVFECRAVLDFSKFEAMVPEPKPPLSKRPGQEKATPNPEHPKFVQEVGEYSLKKTNWLYIQSISDSPGMEWEQVKLDDPGTWHLWMKELTDAGITFSEMTRIQAGIHAANGMDDEKIDEARKRFLATRPAGSR